MSTRSALVGLILACGAFGVAHAEPPAPNDDPRGEVRTLASFPEWYIVYSAEEYARFVAAGGMPSEFPYFGAIRQYWETLDIMRANLGDETIDEESQTVLNVIGASFTVEYGIIGAYELTIGRLSELASFGRKSPADLVIDANAARYAEFLYQTPWYRFPYFAMLRDLWQSQGASLFTSIRSFERMSVFSIGYGVKGIYGSILTYLSRSAFGYVGMETEIALENATTSAPRYRAFRDPALSLLRSGTEFRTIQGNERILVSAIAPRGTACTGAPAPIFEMPILTDEGGARYGYLVPVPDLRELVVALDACNASIEHLYDY